MVTSAPAVRLYLGSRELTPADVPEGIPSDPTAAERLLRALLTGQPPGTRGRVDVLRYPTRRGAHAYEAAVRLIVHADGVPREAMACDGPTCPCDGRDSADPPIILATAGE